MNGTISHHNPSMGFVAVETDTGYSIFELQSEMEYEIGDTVSWQPDTACGHTVILNRTRNRATKVFFQNHWVHRDDLRQQLQMD